VGRPGVQPTCRVASRPARDYSAELLLRDRELGYRDHVAIGEILQLNVSQVQFLCAIELVGQATRA